MIKSPLQNPLSFRRACSLLLALGSASLLVSCSTTPRSDAGTFRIRVVRYEPPIKTAAWTAGPLLAADPEGAAFDVVSAMQQGNVEQWLSYCEDSARVSPTPAARQALLKQWQPLQGGTLIITGRVIAGANVVVEFSLLHPQRAPEKLQIPLTKSSDRWWLTAMDPSSEYLNWENSPNPIVDHMDPDALGRMREPLLQSVAISR